MGNILKLSSSALAEKMQGQSAVKSIRSPAVSIFGGADPGAAAMMPCETGCRRSLSARLKEFQRSVGDSGYAESKESTHLQMWNWIECCQMRMIMRVVSI